MLIGFIKRHNVRQIWVLFLEEYLGAILRCVPGYEGMLVRWLSYKMMFKKIGKKALIWPSVYITHSYNIVAGNHLAINRGSHIDGRGGIKIGDYVLIGPNVFIGSSNHVVSPADNKPRIFLGHSPDPVSIGNNVWIGANAVICPGVSIGDNSVIGAGSVVTKNVPESVVVVGSPGRVVKTL
ncbi:MAG: sugar O-acetyltransferase [Candidatus Omnitrophica bacterium]|nr:sugar O-acetyltransferase [Candidatus Omnitrophota bacterium]